jgi:hypothetical protein
LSILDDKANHRLYYILHGAFRLHQIFLFLSNEVDEGFGLIQLGHNLPFTQKLLIVLEGLLDVFINLFVYFWVKRSHGFSRLVESDWKYHFLLGNIDELVFDIFLG